MAKEDLHPFCNILRDFFGHIMGSFQSHTSNGRRPLLPQSQGVKAFINNSVLGPQDLERGVKAAVAVCIIMLNINGGGSAVIFTACMNSLRVFERGQVLVQCVRVKRVISTRLVKTFFFQNPSGSLPIMSSGMGFF